MGLVARKPDFGVSDKVGFKPVCSATYTSLKVEISLEASLDMIHSKKRKTKALIRLSRYAVKTPVQPHMYIVMILSQPLFQPLFQVGQLSVNDESMNTLTTG